jgi:hypothetical protein
VCYIANTVAKRKARSTYGLYARNYPKSVRDRLDIDYADKLTPELRVKLAGLLDQIHGADFRAAGATQDRDFRRARYREKNAANKDIWGLGLRDMGEPVTAGTLLDPGGDHNPGPVYLESPQYKQALAEYREALDRKASERVKARLLAKLEATKRSE